MFTKCAFCGGRLDYALNGVQMPYCFKCSGKIHNEDRIKELRAQCSGLVVTLREIMGVVGDYLYEIDPDCYGRVDTILNGGE